MTASIARSLLVARPGHLLAVGAALAAFGLLATSPLGDILFRAVLEGWLAIYVDADAFRLFCI